MNNIESKEIISPEIIRGIRKEICDYAHTKGFDIYLDEMTKRSVVIGNGEHKLAFAILDNKGAIRHKKNINNFAEAKDFIDNYCLVVEIFTDYAKRHDYSIHMKYLSSCGILEIEIVRFIDDSKNIFHNIGIRAAIAKLSLEITFYTNKLLVYRNELLSNSEKYNTVKKQLVRCRGTQMGWIVGFSSKSEKDYSLKVLLDYVSLLKDAYFVEVDGRLVTKVGNKSSSFTHGIFELLGKS